MTERERNSNGDICTGPHSDARDCPIHSPGLHPSKPITVMFNGRTPREHAIDQARAWQADYIATRPKEMAPSVEYLVIRDLLAFVVDESAAGVVPEVKP